MRDILSELQEFTDEEKDPVRKAQVAMKRPLPKRFYETVGIGSRDEGGHALLLDGKGLKTPGRQSFILPSRKLAEAVAAEWDAQKDRIDPAAMPLTRICNTALDGVSRTMGEVRGEILAFAGSDMLCYRADTPDRLVAIQAEKWDPYLTWIKERHGAQFSLAQGVIHVAQPEATLAIIDRLLSRIGSPLALASMHVLTSLTGSVILPLALAGEEADADSVWAAAHVDEDWSISQWGEDYEAAQRRIARRKEFDAAVTILANAAPD